MDSLFKIFTDTTSMDTSSDSKSEAKQNQKKRTLTRLQINFADRELKYGIRSDFQRTEIKLDGKVSAELMGRLWKKNGVIQNAHHGPMGGPVPNTGVLCYRNADHWNGEDCRLTINRDYKRDVLAQTRPAKFSSEFHCKSWNNIADATEFIIIKMYFLENPAGEVLVFPLSKALAKFEDPRYGSATITLPPNDIWESVDLYYSVPDPEDENFAMGTGFSYLNLKSSAPIQLGDDLFELTPAMGMSGGGGAAKKHSLR